MIRALVSIIVACSLSVTAAAQTLRGAPRPNRSGVSTALAALPSTIDVSVQAYANAVATAGGAAIGATRLQQLSTMVAGLKADGVWSKLDWLVIMAAPDAYAARFNLVGSVEGRSTKSLTSYNSTPFTANAGYAGDGTTGSTNYYLDAGEAPGASGNSYAQNSASMFVYVNGVGTGSSSYYEAGVASSNGLRIATNATTAANFNINDTTATTYATPGSRTGLRTVVRPDSATKVLYVNAGGSPTSASVASGAVPTGDLVILRANASYSPDRVSAFGSGSALTATDVSNLYSRLTTFFAAASIPY